MVIKMSVDLPLLESVDEAREKMQVLVRQDSHTRWESRTTLEKMEHSLLLQKLGPTYTLKPFLCRARTVNK